MVSIAVPAQAGPTKVLEDGRYVEYDDLRRDRPASPTSGALMFEGRPLGPRGTVLLVHGFDSSPDMWRGQVKLLEAWGLRAVPLAWEPTRPGMTLPEVADEVLRPAIAAALEDDDLPPPLHAIGHSTGGLLLRWLVEQPSEDPLELDSLVLLSTPNAGARTGIAAIACDTYKQPWRQIACELKPDSETLQALGTTVPPGLPTRYLSIGVETLPNLLPAPLFDGDGDGRAHSHDNAVMAESAWLDGAEFRIWRGRRTRSHFTVACSRTVADWVFAFLLKTEVPPQAEGRLDSADICRDPEYDEVNQAWTPVVGRLRP